MKTWNLKTGDPGAFILAADSRCGPTDYVNDHIWNLHLERSEPPSLALRTTFGLRAPSLRLFPRIIEGDTAVHDPASFNSPPVVKSFYPNFLRVAFSPFMGIDVQVEYWVPNSHAVAGRIHITNSRLSTRQIRLEWVALLRPSPDGHRMAVSKMESATILSGKTDGIVPVFLMSGSPQDSSGPYPALSVDLDLAPGSTRQFVWAQAGLSDIESSFSHAKDLLRRDWEAEIARLDILNGRILDIETGNKDWDAALALAQKSALGMFAGPTEHLPNRSIVLSRQPDQGFSPRGDGLDYTHLWNGQSVMETDYLISLILPSAPSLAKDVFGNFLSIQTKRGFIDWKPGMGGQRGRMLATPLLTNIAWRIYQTTEDINFLDNAFPYLLSFIQAWFTPDQDRDGDGLPEWAHPLQSGYEDHPAFSQWYSWAQGADITKVESPALCAFLFREIQLLIRMGRLLDRSEPILALEALADNLRSAVEASWDSESNNFRYWDRETHLLSLGSLLGKRQGPGEIVLQCSFEHPVRLLLQIQSTEDRSRQASAFIHGLGASGNHRVESILDTDFQWLLGRGNVTSNRVYQEVEHIQIEGIESDDQVTIQVTDLTTQDHTLLLPLWARIPDQTKAKKLIKHTITNENLFWHPFGIPAYIHHHIDEDIDSCHHVHLPWNNLIGEALVYFGHHEDAVTLFTRLMAAIIENLKQNQGFFQYYHSQTGQGIGEQNALSGLPPLGLFLEILGVNIISSRRVLLKGHNPFPMPITLRFRGMTIFRESKQTKITFPGGQTAIIRNPKPRIVTVDE
ncbi:hypothetical protein ACFLXI_08150 [Chloroflexota bacterium]